MIKLSKKWSYALKSVLYIASKSPQILKIKDISYSQNISESMLRRIIANLEKTNILKTIKGRNWWVILYKEIKEISIYDILLAVDESLWIRDCTAWQICKNINTCNTTLILNDLQKGFNTVLKMYSLEKIIKKDL